MHVNAEGLIVDESGRVVFTEHTQSPKELLRPSAHQIAWMQFVMLHGAQSSHNLHALTPKNRHDFSEQLKAVYDAQLFYKPIFQQYTFKPDRNAHIYDLTEKGVKFLKERGLWVETVRPTSYTTEKGKHQFGISTVTATYDIMCRRTPGFRYIPPHEYLQGKPLAYEVPFAWEGKSEPVKKYLRPDAVFAIDYGNNAAITYFVEVDRNNERGVTDTPDKKSDKRMIRQYGAFIGKKLYRQAYGRNSMAMLLYITVNPTHEVHFREDVARELGPSVPYIATTTVENFGQLFRPPHLLTQLFDKGLARVGREPWIVGKAI